MATQGMITIVDSQNQVQVKIIAGCDGYNVNELAKKIKKNMTLDNKKLYRMARLIGFGCKACLVVQTKQRIEFKGDEREWDLYIEHFYEPEFNPRWSCGMIEHFRTVTYKKKHKGRGN